MEVLAVGIAIGASSRAIGFFEAVAGNESLMARGHAAVGLLQIQYPLHVAPANLRAHPVNAMEWSIERWADEPETMTVERGRYVGSPVRYLGRREAFVRWDDDDAGELVPLDPGRMLAALLVPMVQEVRKVRHEDDLREVVLTAPLGYGPAWLEHTADACRIAKVELAAALPEPAAVLTHYAFALPRTWSPGERVLVFDWGGGALKLTLVRYRERDAGGDAFDVLAALALPEVGGLVIDQRIGRDMARQVGSVARLGRDHERVPRLLGLARNVKVTLANKGDDGPAVWFPSGVRLEYNRNDLQRLLHGNPDRGDIDIPETIGHAVRDLRNLGGGIDRVLLAGGGGRMPVAMRVLRHALGAEVAIEAFGETEHGSLDQVAARGATVHAAQLQGLPGAGMPIALNLPPLLAHDIVIRQRGGASVHLLRAGMPLDRPMRVTRSLATANAGDLRLECMRFGGGHAPRRLAGLNLGPIPEGTLISCRLEMANRDVGALSVRWDGGFLGPAPIRLGD